MTGRQETFKAVAMTVVAFTVCFGCWVINSVLITALTSWGTFPFSESQVGWLLAAPILTGALARLPVGLLSDRFGGRLVLIVLMTTAAIPLFLLSQANSYSSFLMASLGFGLAGSSFAACVTYISAWVEKSGQGTALGILGVGNAGAAATTLLSPSLLAVITENGTQTERWRILPQLFAGALALMAFVFWLTTKDRRAPTVKKTLRSQVESLADATVWRFGLYYALMFGGFLALAQWIVPYTLNTYRLSLAQAGLIASMFSLPAGLVRAAGGRLADRFGALTIMYYVFGTAIMVCTLLSIPRMDIQSPGEGVSAKAPGMVTSVSSNAIAIGNRTYPLAAQPDTSSMAGDSILPSITRWQVPAVALGEKVAREQLIAAGVTRIFYPSSIWLFIPLIMVLGLAMGVGSAGVYRLIPDQFPLSVGLVGGTVGVLGGLGGFIFTPIFSYLVHGTGLWSSCWVVLAALALICLLWMHVVARRVVLQQVPELVELLEKLPLPGVAFGAQEKAGPSVETALKQIPWFANFSGAELQSIERIGRTCFAAQDEYLFREGDLGDSLYLILSGSVDVVRQGADGTEIWLASLSAGEFFGELAIIDGGTRSATVRARENTELFLLLRRDFLSLVAKSPHMLADLLIGLSGKVRHVSAQYYEAAIQQNKLRLEQEINRLRSMGEMIAGLAHEINTPLGIVNHASSIVAERIDSEKPDAKDDIREASKLIQDGVRRAHKLVKTFKHLSASQVSDSKAIVNIRTLIDECTTLYALKARASRLRINVVDQLAQGDGQWEGYPGHFSQIILNLLTNADRYAYPEGNGGEVRIVLDSKPSEYLVTVQDFGRGIQAEDLPRVFDPFFTTGRDSGGTGLGMAIVQNLVTASLQGDIQLESAPGKGTAVKLIIPRICS
jgi:MFS transporter, NNP family, nitrate/nitrite transporter